MTKAVVVHRTGGPEVLSYEDVEVGEPGPGQIKVRHHAIGLNFIDIYQRSGLYKLPLPFVGGNEGAGEVIAVGPGVTAFKPGHRIVHGGPVGAYAEERLLPEGKAVHLPDGIDYETAAAAMTKGTTAYYLLFRTHKVRAGETVLIQAAAGGTGSILVQWAKALGARVIATAGGPDKAAQVKAHGADRVVDYKAEDFVAAVKDFTGGKGVDVVYDGVGQAIFERSLDCLRPLGLMVSFGNASGPVSIPSLTVLAEKGSLFLTRPTTATYYRTPQELREAADALFGVIQSGAVKIAINQRFKLSEVHKAHEALEGRRTTGATVLLP